MSAAPVWMIGFARHFPVGSIDRHDIKAGPQHQSIEVASADVTPALIEHDLGLFI